MQDTPACHHRSSAWPSAELLQLIQCEASASPDLCFRFVFGDDVLGRLDFECEARPAIQSPSPITMMARRKLTVRQARRIPIWRLCLMIGCSQPVSLLRHTREEISLSKQ